MSGGFCVIFLASYGMAQVSSCTVYTSGCSPDVLLLRKFTEFIYQCLHTVSVY